MNEHSVPVLYHKNISLQSAQMLHQFFQAVADKFAAAEEKHQWKDEWRNIKDEEELFMKACKKHLEKGDPIDVCIYLAIMHYYDWGTIGVLAP